MEKPLYYGGANKFSTKGKRFSSVLQKQPRPPPVQNLHVLHIYTDPCNIHGGKLVGPYTSSTYLGFYRVLCTVIGRAWRQEDPSHLPLLSTHNL